MPDRRSLLPSITALLLVGVLFPAIGAPERRPKTGAGRGPVVVPAPRAPLRSFQSGVGARHTPVPGANFRISAGTTSGALSQGALEYGDYMGLAFHAGTFYPLWGDNSPELPGNPDAPSLDLATAACTFSGGQVTVGPNRNTSVRADNQTGGNIAINPVDPLNLVAVSNTEEGDGIFRAYSTDGGATWTGQLIADGMDGLPAAFADPCVAFDSFGNCFLSYLGLTQTNVHVAVSTDGGATFVPSAVVGSALANQPFLATGSGNAGGQAVWLLFADLDALGLGEPAMVLAGAPVTGLGQVGSFVLQVCDNSADADFGEVAVGPAGEVAVAYQTNIFEEGNSTIVFHLEPDGLGPQPLGNGGVVTTTNVGGLDAIPAQELRTIDAEVGLAWDRSGGQHHGRLYMVYLDEDPSESNNTNVYLRFSTNAGVSWSNRIRVNDDAGTRSQFLPKIALDQTTGNVVVVWHDCRNDPASGAGDRDGLPNTDAQVWGSFFDETTPVSTLQFAPADYQRAESPSQVTVTVTRAGATTTPASVQFATANGTATAGQDYTANSGTLNFAPGQLSRTFNVTILPDNRIEPDETVLLSLASPIGATLGEPVAGTITILDDRAGLVPSGLTVSPVAPGQARLDWTDNAGNEDVVEIERKEGAGPFSPRGAVGANVVTFTDTGLVPGVTYTYRVRAGAAGVFTDYSNEAATTITLIELSQDLYAGSEQGPGPVQVRLVRTGNLLAQHTVELTTSDGTAGAPADFVDADQTVVFAPGAAQADVPVTLLGDNLLEGPESFPVAIANPAGPAVFLGARTGASVTIADDTQAPAPTELSALVAGQGEVHLNWTDRCGNETGFELQRSEDGGPFGPLVTVGPNVTDFTDDTAAAGIAYRYRVRAVRDALQSDWSNEADVSLSLFRFSAPQYAFQEGGTFSVRIDRIGDAAGSASVQLGVAPGSAQTPQDFADPAGTIVFDSGVTSRLVPVQVASDTALEGQESFTVTLSNPQGGPVLGAPATATVTIADDPTPATPSGLVAEVLGATTIRLRWTDNSIGETAFQVERRQGAAPFSPLATVPAGTTLHVDGAAPAGAPVEYRVRALGPSDTPFTPAVQAMIPLGGKARVTPKALKFGTVRVNRVKRKVVRIQNRGTGDLAGEVQEPGGPYVLVSGGGLFVLAPRAVRVVTVEFRPTAAGPQNGTLTITTTDPTKPEVGVPLRARGR